jgi:amino acid transporter
MKLALALAGEKIVIAGLALQVATFVVFLVASVDFQIRMRRKAPSSTLNNNLHDWKKMLRILYAVSTLILFRCTFRLIEYSMGNAGYLTAHEWPLYCFDAVPMFLVLVLLLVLQPTRYVQDTEKKESTSAVLDSSESEVV